MVPRAHRRGHVQFFQLRGEGLRTGFQAARQKRAIQGEAGLTRTQRFGVIGAPHGLERGLLGREFKVIADARAHVVPREELCAGPVEKSAGVVALANLEHHIGHVVRRAGLPEFIREQPWRAARRPVGQQAFVVTARAARTVTHQQREAQHGCELGGRHEHGLLAGEFLAGVQVDRARGVGGGVRRGPLPVEDLL